MSTQDLPVTLSVEDGPGESVTIRLRNDYNIPLAAYTGSFDNKDANGKDIALALLPEDGTPPGQTEELQLAKPAEPESLWKLQAVVFLDGSSAGDEGAVNRILDTRRKAYLDIPEAIATLTAKAPIEAFRIWYEADLQIDWEAQGPALLAGKPLELPPDPVVPQRVMELMEAGKPEEEILQLLRQWHDRLAQSQPPIPTTPPPQPDGPSPHPD